MGLFFYNKIGSIIPMVVLPTTEIIEPEIHVLEAIRENSTREMKELIDETIRDTFKDRYSKEISDIYKNVIKQAELLLV